MENERRYVKVRADHYTNGMMKPLMFREEDGEKVIIDKIVDMRFAPSLKEGGQGLRYTCQIGSTYVYLFFDQGYWFLEIN